MKSRLEGIIQDLDNCIKEDIKVSSQIFGLAATSIQKNQELLEQLQQTTEDFPKNQPALPATETYLITKESLQKQYKSYNAAYQFYHDKYGITCRKGWKHLLKAIEEHFLSEKQPNLQERVNTLENQVQQLEKTVNILVDFIKNLDPSKNKCDR